MNRPPLFQRAAAAAFGLAALAAAGAAQARSDVYFPVHVQPHPVYVHPQPVYGHPQPVYVQPRPVYVQPGPVYLQPRPMYVPPWRIYLQPQPVFVPRHDYHDRHHRRGPWGDHDGDGVPNRYDPDHPRNQWRHADRHHHGYRY